MQNMFFNYTGIKLETKTTKIRGKYQYIWKSNNTDLNNPLVKDILGKF